MVAVAEEANSLEKVLVDIADGLEKRTARNLELMVRLLEPIMLLVMAGMTLLIVVGLLLPVFKMGSAVGELRWILFRFARVTGFRVCRRHNPSPSKVETLTCDDRCTKARTLMIG